MSKLDFANVDVLIVDNDLNTRQSVKNILHNNGHREIRLGQNLGNVREVLEKSMPDLLICSCDLPDGDFLSYIREIRTASSGNNPFLPIITLVETPTPELVTRIIESGTDTVIAKPISTAQLLDRIDDIIEARKKFVVADSYVGPARRKDQALRGVEPPNLLRAKAEGQKLSFAEVEQMINGALGKMNVMKVDVLGAQISTHITNLVPMLERSGRLDPTIRQELLSLLDITPFPGKAHRHQLRTRHRALRFHRQRGERHSRLARRHARSARHQALETALPGRAGVLQRRHHQCAAGVRHRSADRRQTIIVRQ